MWHYTDFWHKWHLMMTTPQIMTVSHTYFGRFWLDLYSISTIQVPLQ